ncbi:MAG: peroxiredoxin [Saprospiraceae bacterium]|jgi:peroxiredoxin
MQDIHNISNIVTNRGRSLVDASSEMPVLLVFLRHFGCVFCREAMIDISKKREDWEKQNINVVLVHMSDFETAEKYFKKFNVPGIENISDPTCGLYASFGLSKGNASQLFGLKNFIRGFETTIKGIPIGLRQIGDGFQMPGVFLIRNGKVLESYIHKSAADRPDYDSLIQCSVT